MEMEVWKDIPSKNHYKYQVSNLGRVKSLPKSIKYSDGRTYHYKSKVLTPKPTGSGYLKVNIFHAVGKSVTWDVHRLVAIAFLPNPENKREVNHIDGDKTNNKLLNLEWNTSQENKIHGFKTGLYSGDRMGPRRKQA